MRFDPRFRLLPLSREHVPSIEAHLLGLDVDDRSLRFSAALVTDDTLRRYVDGMRFGHDAVFGLVDDPGRVVALAHGCVFDTADGRRLEAAFSVDAPLRGRGLGTRLMQAVDAFACARGLSAIVGLCALRNQAMRRIFERAGMQLTREDDGWHARRWLHARAGHGPVLSGRSGKLACRAAAAA